MALLILRAVGIVCGLGVIALCAAQPTWMSVLEAAFNGAMVVLIASGTERNK